MYTLETSTADLEHQQTLDPEAPDEFDDDLDDDDDDNEETPASRDTLRHRNATLETVHLTMPVGAFSGWGPRITSQIGRSGLN